VLQGVAANSKPCHSEKYLTNHTRRTMLGSAHFNSIVACCSVLQRVAAYCSVYGQTTRRTKLGSAYLDSVDKSL